MIIISRASGTSVGVNLSLAWFRVQGVGVKGFRVARFVVENKRGRSTCLRPRPESKAGTPHRGDLRYSVPWHKTPP